MKRYRTLLFPSFQFFRDWYSRMKQRFTRLALSLIRHGGAAQSVRVVITY